MPLNVACHQFVQHTHGQRKSCCLGIAEQKSEKHPQNKYQ